MIDGRGGMTGLDPAVQNWESGVEFTVLRSTFFRNTCGYRGGALATWDVWPLVHTVEATDVR